MEDSSFFPLVGFYFNMCCYLVTGWSYFEHSLWFSSLGSAVFFVFLLFPLSFGCLPGYHQRNHKTKSIETCARRHTRTQSTKKAAFFQSTNCRVANKLIVVRAVLELLSHCLKMKGSEMLWMSSSKLSRTTVLVFHLANVIKSQHGTQSWRCPRCECRAEVPTGQQPSRVVTPCGSNTMCGSSCWLGDRCNLDMLAQH